MNISLIFKIITYEEFIPNFHISILIIIFSKKEQCFFNVNGILRPSLKRLVFQSGNNQLTLFQKLIKRRDVRNRNHCLRNKQSWISLSFGNSFHRTTAFIFLFVTFLQRILLKRTLFIFIVVSWARATNLSFLFLKLLIFLIFLFHKWTFLGIIRAIFNINSMMSRHKL
jgi:hypothetical protein